MNMTTFMPQGIIFPSYHVLNRMPTHAASFVTRESTIAHIVLKDRIEPHANMDEIQFIT